MSRLPTMPAAARRSDADFVPVVEEVKKHGVMVVVAATQRTCSEELRRAADRFIAIDNDQQWFPPMTLK